MATTLPVRWTMPAMKPGYTVIDLSKTGTQTSWNFASDQDVMFIGSTTTRTLDRIYVTGGNNIAVIGGKYEPTGGSSATIHVNGVRGNVYIEGVHIDHRNSPSKDGIGVAGSNGSRPNVYIQNSIIDNITGTQNGVHGDMVQRYGQLGDVKIYNLSGSTNYQGLFLNPHPGYEIRSVELENVDIIKLPGGDARTWTYYFYSPGQNQAYPVKLKNVFSSDGNVFPPPGYAEGATISGNKISFPNKAFSGNMSLGHPTGGDFVKAADIGIGYKHGPVLGATPSAPATGKTVAGTAANDKLAGTDGNDILDGRAGADTMTGGKGNDVYRVDNANDRVVEKAGEGYDTIKSSVSVNWLAPNVEKLVLTGTADISGTGNAQKNQIVGNAGDNWLSGGGGADTLNGGGGYDWANYQHSPAAVKVDLAAGTGKGGWGQGNILKNIEAVRGSKFNDTLTGNAKANTLDGGAGSDVLRGAGGNDMLRGGGGNDKLLGGQGNDSLAGGSGNDVLNGGAGKDRLDGGVGSDTLTGGGGNDTFIFRSGGGSDVITDFQEGSGAGDVIRLIDTDLSNFKDVKSAASQVGPNTVIDLGQGDSIKLLNVSALSLAADDFTFG